MRKKHRLAGVVIGLASIVLFFGIHQSSWFEDLELLTFNVRSRLAAAPAPPDIPIRLILIDQDSLNWAQAGPGLSWPWPWELYAYILELCQRGGARAVMHDAVFSESVPEREDERFFRSIGESRVYVTGLAISDAFGSLRSWPDAEYRSRARLFELEGMDALEERTRDALRTPSVLCPIPELLTDSTYIGHVHVEPDRDSLIRRMRPVRVFDGEVVPSLALAAYAASSGSRNLRIERGRLSLDGKSIPLDRDGRTTLRFRRPSPEYGGLLYPNYSAMEVIRSALLVKEGEMPSVAPEVFQDCFVFLGASAAGIFDEKPHPADAQGLGVDLQATFLDNLLEDCFIRDAPPALALSFSAVWIFLIGVVTVWSRSAGRIALIGLIGILVPAGVGYFAYLRDVWWPVATPEAGVSTAWLLGAVFNLATEGRQRRFVRRAFEQYLSRAVIQQIVDDPSRLRLGGEEKTLTIFFSDLEKFSSICHDLDPQTITGLLNDYLTDMTDIIFEEGGTLDKYEGDAIIAFWNAPTDQPDHAIRACRAALRCQRQLASRHDEFSRRAGGKPFRMRIGIHTGRVVVGNMGSLERFDYTILGDAANLAARLEGANKAFGTYLMVSHDTWSETDGAFIGRETAEITVVGRPTPVRVVEPLGFRGEPSPPFLDTYEAALAFCRRGQTEEALSLFEEIPDDPVASRYAEHLRSLSREDRSAWRGVWNLSAK